MACPVLAVLVFQLTVLAFQVTCNNVGLSFDVS